MGLRERGDSGGEAEAAVLAARVVEPRRASAAARPLADLRGHRTLAERGFFGRCVRDHALAYVIVVSTFFGYGTWYWLMARYQASTVAPFTLLVPIVGILTAWLVRSEHPSFGELFGSFVVLVGLGLALGVLDAVAARGSASTSVGA